MCRGRSVSLLLLSVVAHWYAILLMGRRAQILWSEIGMGDAIAEFRLPPLWETVKKVFFIVGWNIISI